MENQDSSVHDVEMEDSAVASTEGIQMGHILGLGHVSEPMSPASMSMSTTLSMSAVRGRSKVWNEFVVTQDGKKVTCRQCGDSLSYSHSHSTSSMLKHLKRKHCMDLYPPTDDDCPKPPSAIKTPAEKIKKGSKSKKVIKELPDEPEPSIQHGPLIFSDPCVRMRWTDHSDTFLRTFSILYDDESYTDVTLVAEKQFFRAHRVILSSASEFFDEMFKLTPAGQHPIIFLKDIKAMELRILLDFIYKGEVAIPPSLIPGLVRVGSELKVKGLSDFVWNDSMASTVFQGYQNDFRPAMSQNQQTTSVQPPITPTYTAMSGSTTGTNMSTKLVTPIRTIFRHTAPLVSSAAKTTLAPSGATLARTFTRILTNVCAAGAMSNQNLTSVGSGTVSSTSVPSLKRIRILTARASPNKTGPTRFDLDASGTTGLTTLDGDSGAETVLMVTNQGETVLSTSQGGVTVVAPRASISMPISTDLKTEHTIHDHQTLAHEHNPITVLTSASDGDTHDLEEVVYSITEVPNDGHQVLMSDTGDGDVPETIVVYGSREEHNAAICDSEKKSTSYTS